MGYHRYKWLKFYSVCITAVCLLSIFALGFLLHREGYDEKLLVKLGLKEPVSQGDWAVGGWNNTLMKMDYDADIVFLGDSITAASDFRAYFPNRKIVNLGYHGDTLVGMIDRVPGVAAVSPEKVFVMGGINGLTDLNADICLNTYSQLLDELAEALPESQIYVQSTLPIAAVRERYGCSNRTIADFNQALDTMAQQRGMTFVDLHSLYSKGGEMDPEYSYDGLHLLSQAYALWADAITPYID